MTREPDNTPDWIKRRKQVEGEAERQAAERSHRNLEAAMSIGTGGPEFWNEFVAQVKVNTDALEPNFTRTMDEKIVGHTISELESPHTPERTCTIEVIRHSVKFGPDSRKTHLYYRPRGFNIRRVYQGKEDKIDLTIEANEIRVDVYGTVLTAKDFASHIVESMVKPIKFPDAR